VLFRSISYSSATPGGGVLYTSNYGNATIRIPKFRQKVPQTGQWSNWWAEDLASPAFLETDAFTTTSVNTTSQDANNGVGRYRMIDMMWDGQEITQTAAEVNATAPNVTVTKLQMGWVIISSGLSTFNNAVQASGYEINPSCFIAGTNISLSNGDYKNIEDMLPGETVVTYNETTGLIEDGIVGSITEHQVPAVIKLLFVDGTDITTTPEHPFFIEGQWIKAGELQVGHNTQKLNGNKLAISEIKLIEEPHTVYNLLNVGNNHNFYVNETLVHNKGGAGEGG